MPQLQFGDPLVLAQAVWMLVIFGVLYYVLRTYVLPPVGEVLEHRAARIAADLDAARQAKMTADNALTELRAATAQARTEVSAGWTAHQEVTPGTPPGRRETVRSRRAFTARSLADSGSTRTAARAAFLLRAP